DTHIMLATLGGELSARQRLEARRVGNITVRESQYRLEWMTAPWDSLEAAGDWLLALEREFEPAIVHLNHLAHGDLPWRAPVLVVGHSCVLSWLQAVRGGVEPGFERYRDCVKRSLERANRVVAPTQAMMQALEL